MIESVFVGIDNRISLLTLVIILTVVLLMMAALWYWGDLPKDKFEDEMKK